MTRQILRYIIYFISFIVKPRKTLVFNSFPSFSDNPYALYMYLINNDFFKNYKKVWIIKEKDKHIIKYKDSKTIISNSTLKNWYYIITARFIFSSHLAYGYLKFRQKRKMINLWHGMPMKKIVYDNSYKGTIYDFDITAIATNARFQNCMSSAFKINKNNVIINGQPRTDLLFETIDKSLLPFNKEKYNSVGIWMPTFRQTKFNDSFDTSLKETDLSYWNHDTLSTLNDFLYKTNNLLILKLHPADLFQKKELGKYSNIIILKTEDFPHRFLYQLLGSMDYLITDYSSVFIDFDITKKPMAFILDDEKEYENNRGFYFENIKEKLPGKILHTNNDLNDFIINHNNYIIDTKDYFNLYKDNRNRERLTKWLINEI